MRAVSLGIVSFARSKSGRAVVFGLFVFMLVLGLSLAPAGVKVAQACSYTKASAYADYHMFNGVQKRGVYVWSPNGDKSVQIWFRDRFGNDFRVKDSEYEIRQSSPTARSGGWQIHHIATRFKPTLDILGGAGSWNDDWRWTVRICS